MQLNGVDKPKPLRDILTHFAEDSQRRIKGTPVILDGAACVSSLKLLPPLASHLSLQAFSE